MHAQYADAGLAIVAVSVDVDIADARKFLDEYPARFATFLDADGKMAHSYDLPGMPTSFIFDRKGQRVSRHAGFRGKDAPELEKTLKALLGAGQREPEAGGPQ